MQLWAPRTVLESDLFSADGRLLVPRGERIDLSLLKKVASSAPSVLHERSLFETPLAASVMEAFDESPLQHLIGGEERRALTAETLGAVRFPQPVWDEVEALRSEDAPRYQHAIWTAVIAARLFRVSLGPASGVARLVGGALAHDVGMRHVAAGLRRKEDHLSCAEARTLEAHPLVGALLLASSLGNAPAVHFALLHHTDAGFRYGRASGELPLREVDLVSVASAFAALIAPRSYRQQPYDPRGAVDQLVDDARAGKFDLRAIRLLIRCLRGAKAHTELDFPCRPTGFRPKVNHHGVSGSAACAQ